MLIGSQIGKDKVYFETTGKFSYSFFLDVIIFIDFLRCDISIMITQVNVIILEFMLKYFERTMS